MEQRKEMIARAREQIAEVDERGIVPEGERLNRAQRRALARGKPIDWADGRRRVETREFVR